MSVPAGALHALLTAGPQHHSYHHQQHLHLVLPSNLPLPTGTIRTRVTPGVSSLRMMIPAFSDTNTAGMPGSGWSRGLLMMMRASYTSSYTMAADAPASSALWTCFFGNGDTGARGRQGKGEERVRIVVTRQLHNEGGVRFALCCLIVP